jgi:hypothetical protein
MFGQPRSTSSEAGLCEKNRPRAESPRPILSLALFRASVSPLGNDWRQVHALSAVGYHDAQFQVMRSL